jgi:hypothetical protein
MGRLIRIGESWKGPRSNTWMIDLARHHAAKGQRLLITGNYRMGLRAVLLE